ncbi:sensor histidine kinase [Streptococcus lutetiensis]|uniref:sensor histidine kinase n=1 Tax=Streptococcus lutetiensis TaxID=150055 RepID=UPI001965D3FB|nr:GHKL domain-containing protein [Streptococcus lutetiensis]
MLDYLVLCLTVYPIILYIYSNVRGEKLGYIEKSLAIIVFVVVAHSWFYFISGNFIVLILLSYFKNKELPTSLHVFYGVFPWLVEGVFRRLTAFFFLPIIGLNYIDIDRNNFVFVTVELVSLIIYIGLVKMSKFNFQAFIEMVNINKLKVFLVFTDISMVLFYVAMEFLTGMEFKGGVSTLYYREWLVVIYFIFFILMLFYMNRSYQNRLEKEIASAREQELRYLSAYSKKVEGLYEELRAFRHDYANILVSLKEGIEQDDMGLVRKIYDSVLEDSADFIRNSKFNIGRLANIEDDAIKSLLSAKFLEAEANHIEVNLEVKDKIGVPDIPLLDYIRLLAILCDNAIEAALEAENPAITIACFYQDDDYVLIVDNTTKEESVPVNLIYQKDYSSKGHGRGIGLTTIHQMMRKYSNLSVQTNSKNYHFCQTIRIKKAFD